MSSVEHANQQPPVSQPASSQPQRLTGLDLFRGIAALAVVFLHADESIQVMSPIWSLVTQFSAFAVPFFLATSFYLTLNKLCNSNRSYDWGERTTRLLTPFLIWCVLYSGWTAIKLFENGKSDTIQQVLQQLPSLFILGKAGFAFHLYFIPLLLVGTLLLFISRYWIKQRIHTASLVALVIISLVIYQVNSLIQFQIFTTFNKTVFDFILVPLSYLCRCLPYITISLLLIHPQIRHHISYFTTRRYLFLLISLFITINIFDFSFLISSSLYEMLRAYSALFLAFALSAVVPPHPLITSVSLCSFGIYLAHLIVVQLLWSIWGKLGGISNPVPVGMILGIASLGFGISWAITASLSQQKRLARLLFGS